MKYYLGMLLVGFVLMLSSSMVNAADRGPCCIAGTYMGVRSDDTTACNAPESGEFTFVLKQKACEKAITGTATTSSGEVTNFTGEVSFATSRCIIFGTASKADPSIRGRTTPRLTPAGDTTLIKGTIEKDPATRKWQVTDGTYKNKGGCDGTFQMHQQ